MITHASEASKSPPPEYQVQPCLLQSSAPSEVFSSLGSSPPVTLYLKHPSQALGAPVTLCPKHHLIETRFLVHLVIAQVLHIEPSER